MKKSQVVLLAGVMVLALLVSACGGAGASSSEAVAPAPVSSVEDSTTPASGGVSAAEADSADSGTLFIKDMMGREVTLGGPADRVVALSAADCEIVYALGAGDVLVGRGEYCDYPEEVLNLPAVASGGETNIEEIIALEPQVVLMSTMAQTTEQIDQLEEAGITVLASEATDIEGVYEAISMIGAAVGKQAEADALVNEMVEKLGDIENDATIAGEGGTVYFEVSPLEYGLWTAGSGTFMDEIATMLGLENAFADVEGWGEVSEEQVMERNPDYIVTITMYYGEGPTPEEEIAGRTGWGEIGAVKAGNVFSASEDELARPGPRLVDGAEALYDFVYGAE